MQACLDQRFKPDVLAHAERPDAGMASPRSTQTRACSRACDRGRTVITDPLADLHDEFPGGVMVGIQRHRAPRCLERGTKIVSRERISSRL